MDNIFAIGNKKLGNDTVIFSMGTARDCPSKKLGLCQCPNACYALRDEKQYHHSLLPYRIRQAEFWVTCTAQQFIARLLDKVGKKINKIKYFRINESGDFRHQSDVDKLDAIAHKLWVSYGIVTYGYTARKDLNFKGRAMIMQGSGFMLDNNFKYFAKNDYMQIGVNCNVICEGNCRECNLCKIKAGLVIGIRQH